MNMKNSVTGNFAPLDSNVVVAYITQFCNKHDISINATKIQKLMYCCYGVVLVRCNGRLTREAPEAWYYGPVFPSTLGPLKKFGVDYFDWQDTSALDQPQYENVKMWMDDTLLYFGQYSARYLSEWSHRSGSPWAVATESGEVMFQPLDDKMIYQYFKTKVLKEE